MPVGHQVCYYEKGQSRRICRLAAEAIALRPQRDRPLLRMTRLLPQLVPGAALDFRLLPAFSDIRT